MEAPEAVLGGALWLHLGRNTNPRGKTHAIGAKNAENGAGRWKNLPIRAENTKTGAAPSKTSYYSAENHAE